MSTKINHYVVLGIKLDYDEVQSYLDTEEKEDLWEQLLDEYYDSASSKELKDFSIISDGMSGEYIVMGKILGKTGEYTGFDGFVDMDITTPEVYHVSEKCTDILSKIDAEKLDESPQILIFTHSR